MKKTFASLLISLVVFFATPFGTIKIVYGEGNISVIKTIILGEQTIYDDTVCPVDNCMNMSSTFGPREKCDYDASDGCDTYRYDMHLGIDFYGDEKDPIYAVADGIVVSMPTYPNGGKTIVIEHNKSRFSQTESIPLHGKQNDKWFSLYMHLYDGDDAESFVQVGDIVEKGEQIAEMGDSGETPFVHLHLSTRIGTRFTAYCQSQYPQCSSSQSNDNYFETDPESDPDVNPLLLLPGIYSDNDSLDAEIVGISPLKVRVTSDADELDFNKIVVKYKTSQKGGEKIVDFNTREGFDPQDRLSGQDDDINYYDGVLIEPEVFTSHTEDKYAINFTFEDIDNLGAIKEIDVYDIWGKGLKIKVDWKKISDKFGFLFYPYIKY